MDRLRAAIEVASAVPATVRRGRAMDLVVAFAARPGTLGVLWRSVMWQYVPAAERAVLLAHLEEAGAAASGDAPLAHVTFEPRRPAPGQPHELVVATRTWPDGHEMVLGSAPAHGMPVAWR